MADDLFVGQAGADIQVVVDAAIAIPGQDGVGIPAMGLAGQVLTKASTVDYDTLWANPLIGVPVDGTAGQVLTKLSSDPYDTIWLDIPPGVPVGGLTNYVLGKASDVDFDVTWLPTLNGADFVAKAGSTMTGDLILFGDPPTDLSAAPKQYVDTKAPLAHSHIFADVTGLQDALDAKSVVGHTHTIANITGLQGALDGKAALVHTHTTAQVTGLDAALLAKAALSSPVFAGTPTAPTAAPGTNTSQLATTAFVIAAIGVGAYLLLSGGTLTGFLTLNADPTAALHAATKQYVDTKAPSANPAFTGVPTAPTAAPGTNTTQLATTAFVLSTISGGGSFLPISGGTLTGALTLAAGTPASGDAISRGYADGKYALIAHTHAIADTTGLQLALDNRSLIGHVHTIANVTGLQAALDAKSATGHTHVMANITDLAAALLLKANLASPALTGNPTAPTQTAGNNSTRLATTAFVTAAIVAAPFIPVNGVTTVTTGVIEVPTPGYGAVVANKAYVDIQDNLKANLTGATFGGNIATNGGYIHINRLGDGEEAILYIDSDNTENGAIRFRNGPTPQMSFGLFKTISNNFSMLAYDDAETPGTVFSITRLTRIVSFGVSPIAPTPAPGDNTTKLATTEFVIAAVSGAGAFLPITGGTLTGALTLSGGVPSSGHAISRSYADGKYAVIASPTFTGAPAAPTPSQADPPGTRLATTLYVQTRLADNYLALAGGTLVGGLIGTTAAFASNVTTTGGYFQINRSGDTAQASLYIDSDDGQTSIVLFRTGVDNRWYLGKNASSGFELRGFDNAGASLVVFTASRTTAIANFNVLPTTSATTPVASTSTQQFATTAFVQHFVRKDGGTTMTGALNIGGFGIANLAVPVEPTDVMRAVDVVMHRPMGNYNFSEWDTALQPVAGWIGTPAAMVATGGKFGALRMKLTSASAAAFQYVFEEEYHPVDTENYHECYARISASTTAMLVLLGIQCYDLNGDPIAGDPNTWVIGEAAGLNGFSASVPKDVGGYVRFEGSHAQWNFPVGTCYYRRVVGIKGVGDVYLDHFTVRPLGRGEKLSATVFGMRASTPSTALNTYGLANAAAWLRMVAYLVSQGGHCIIPPGTYDIGANVDSTIAIDREADLSILSYNDNPAFTIEGYGQATILRRSALLLTQLFEFNYISNMTLKNFTINNNNDEWPAAGVYSMGSAGVLGTSDATGSGYDQSHILAIRYGDRNVVDGLRVIWGCRGTMVYMTGKDPADVTVADRGPRIANCVIQNCFLDGRDSAANGYLMAWTDDCTIRDSEAIRVRSTLFTGYYYDPDSVGLPYSYYEYATPAMAVQFKHDSNRAVMSNISTVSCRNSIAFTGAAKIHRVPRVTGATIRMSTGSANGLIVTDSWGGVYTGILIDGGDADTDDRPNGSLLSQVCGLVCSDLSQNNAFQAVLRNFTTGSVRAIRAAKFSGDPTNSCHNNYMEISAISDSNSNPIEFGDDTLENTIMIGSIGDVTAMPGGYVTDTGTSNITKHMRALT